MSSHTPGPWHAVIDNENNVTYVMADAMSSGDVCDLYHKYIDNDRVDCGGARVHPKENAEANARLIAAAPEMLNRLEYLYGFHVRLGHTATAGHTLEIINKAKGES